MIKRNEVMPLFSVAVLLFAVALIGAIFTQTTFKTLISLAFAMLVYIIIPGYFILLNFRISSLERIIFGMPVSISVVSVSLYTLDILGIRLNVINILVVIIIICVASLVVRMKIKN